MPYLAPRYFAPRYFTPRFFAEGDSAAPLLFGDFDTVGLADDSDPFGIDPAQTVSVN